MFRNTDLAPDSPATINAMAETGLKLQEDGKTQFPIGVQVGDKGDAYHSYPFFSAAGGYFFGGPDANGNYDINDVGVASDGGLVFAKAWSDFGKKGVVKSTFTGGDLEAAWAAGQAPLLDHRPVEQGQGRGVRRQVRRRAACPAGRASTRRSVPIVGAQGFYLNQISTNKTTAQAFLDATMNTQFMDSLYNADPRPPAWIESANAASSDPIIAAILKFGDGGYPEPALPADGDRLRGGRAWPRRRSSTAADPVKTTEEAQANIEKRIGSGS